MNYWWHVKRYGDEPIRITEKAAKQVIEAISSGVEDILIPSHGLVSAKAISAVEQSLKRIEDDNIYLLAERSGLEPVPYGKGEVVMMPSFKDKGITYEACMTNWWKKNVDRREWDTYYSKIPGYYRIDDPDTSIWVAMRLPVEKNSNMPRHLIECNEVETRELERRL